MKLRRTATSAPASDRPYELRGDLLESCSCRAPCPCWIGADPDNDRCQGFNAYHIEQGNIGEINMDGCDFVRVFDIPGNPRVPNSWKQVVVVDDRASDQQVAAILDAYSGAYGGPLADLARLVDATLGVERARINYSVLHGSGAIRGGRLVSVCVTPFRGADGALTTLHDSLMASVPRAPAYIARADDHTVALDRYGFAWAFEGRSAIQSAYSVAHDV